MPNAMEVEIRLLQIHWNGNCFSVKRTKKEIVKTKFGLKMPRPVPSKPKNNDALILEACFIAGSDHK
jgi:hypothetical protein